VAKVLIGMSGGVDSTVSTYLLKEQGYDVEGVYMKLHNKPGYHETNIARAQKAADFAGVKLHILDAQSEFDEMVFKPFIKSYEDGFTPNPCALCNRNIKFGRMLEFADEIGADFVATGHYLKTDGQYLYEAEDKTKDQSYFLFNIKKEVLPRLLFPLSMRKKSEIKEMASKIPELKAFAEQKESSEICFVETTYTDVLKSHVNVDNEGDVLNRDGEVVGKHKGYMHYTIGKRRGFSVHGAHEPHYVKEIIPEKNQIVVAKEDELWCNEVILEGINMFDTRTEFEATIKLRYRTEAVKCKVTIKDAKADVKLQDGVFGVASGQAGVIYDGQRVLGGGWIA